VTINIKCRVKAKGEVFIKVAQYTFLPKEQKLNIFCLNAFTGLSFTYSCNT
jgi:hypothetical protein